MNHDYNSIYLFVEDLRKRIESFEVRMGEKIDYTRTQMGRIISHLESEIRTRSEGNAEIVRLISRLEEIIKREGGTK